MDFSRLYAPSHLRHVSDTGDQRDHVFASSAESGKVRFFDLSHIEHLIGSGSEFGGVGDFVPILQGMDLPEMVGNATVVASQPHIPIPAGGGLEVAGALGQALKAFIFIDYDR